MNKHSNISLLRECIVALRGARNPRVYTNTLRFLRSVRLTLHPLATAYEAMHKEFSVSLLAAEQIQQSV